MLDWVFIVGTIDEMLVYPVFALSALLIFLSLAAVPPSLSRTYCLNLAVPSFSVTFVAIVIVWREAPGLLFVWIALGYYILLLSSFLEFFASFGYLYFSALTIFLAYVGYAKPLLFPVLTKTRNVVFMFAFGHIWASIAVVTLFPRNIPVVFLGMSADIDFSSVMIVQVFIVIFLYMAMVVLFVLTIVKMRQHAVNVIGNASVSAVHRRVLKSMLIYCTLPNVFAGIALPTYIYSTILEVNGFTRPSHWANTAEMRAWKSTDYLSRPFAGLSYSTGNIRLLANVFTALIAFHDYRVAMKKGLRRIVVPILNAMKISKHNTSIVTFYVDPLFHIPSSRTHVRDARCG